MEMDFIYFIVGGAIFSIYVAAFVLSLFYAFAFEKYKKIEELLYFDIFTTPGVGGLDSQIDRVDVVLNRNHQVVGIFLVLLSSIDLVLFFNLLFQSAHSSIG